MMQTATKPIVVVAAGAEVKPILAERYKTKMCKNYEESGACPYEVRCMFAHGDAELRTKEMNLRDGLVTEDAIREFRRATTGKRNKGSPKNRKQSSPKSAKRVAEKMQSPMLSPCSSVAGLSRTSTPVPSSLGMESISSLPEIVSPAARVMFRHTAAVAAATSPRVYTHNPYNWGYPVLAEDASSSCDCAECAPAPISVKVVPRVRDVSPKAVSIAVGGIRVSL